MLITARNPRQSAAAGSPGRLATMTMRRAGRGSRRPASRRPADDILNLDVDQLANTNVNENTVVKPLGRAPNHAQPTAVVTRISQKTFTPAVPATCLSY
jgi:hypothetical protein